MSPLYGYRCNKCNEENTVICSYKDRANVCCDACGDNNVKWLPSSGQFVMDGKMFSSHPNSPEGQARASEIRKKHIKGHTHKLFKAENKARAKRDGKWSY